MIPAIIAGAAALGTLGAGLYNGYKDRQSKQSALNTLRSQAASSDDQYNQILSGIKSYYNTRGSMGGLQDVKDYKAAIAGYNPEDFVYDRGEFNYGKTVEDFLNPMRDKIVANEIAGVQHSAAGAGLGRGSGAAEAIAQAVADKDEELYRLAQSDYRDDRDFAYRKYSDYANAMQDRLDSLRAATDTKMNLQGNLANDYYSVMDAQQSDLLKARQDKIATGATYAQAMVGLY